MFPDPSGEFFQFHGTDGPASYSVLKYTRILNRSRNGGFMYEWHRVGLYKGNCMRYFRSSVVCWNVCTFLFS